MPVIIGQFSVICDQLVVSEISRLAEAVYHDHDW